MTLDVNFKYLTVQKRRVSNYDTLSLLVNINQTDSPNLPLPAITAAVDEKETSVKEIDVVF